MMRSRNAVFILPAAFAFFKSGMERNAVVMISYSSKMENSFLVVVCIYCYVLSCTIIRYLRNKD